LKSIEEATNVRHKILYAFEVAERMEDPARRRTWLRFVIVGGGPTGVELAGSIAEIARQTLRNDFRAIRPEEAEIILLDGAPRLLMTFPDELAGKASESLRRRGVQVRIDCRVMGVDKDGLTVRSGGKGDTITAKTILWAGGVKASPLGHLIAMRTKAETDRGGRIKVRSDLTILGYPDIYVVGDLASATDHNGNLLPGLAQVAMQGGRYAAKAILRQVERKHALPPFRYFDKGSMAVIGRASAVATTFGAHQSGLIAWLIWAFIHLVYLVNFESFGALEK
jgi:NADH dehydrogenase